MKGNAGKEGVTGRTDLKVTATDTVTLRNIASVGRNHYRRGLRKVCLPRGSGCLLGPEGISLDCATADL